jgi:hypothetical protein
MNRYCTIRSVKFIVKLKLGMMHSFRSSSTNTLNKSALTSPKNLKMTYPMDTHIRRICIVLRQNTSYTTSALHRLIAFCKSTMLVLLTFFIHCMMFILFCFDRCQVILFKILFLIYKGLAA